MLKEVTFAAYVGSQMISYSFSETASQLEEMINELKYVSSNIGLELRIEKTKTMCHHHKTQKPIFVESRQLEHVHEYIYLGKQISFSKSRHRES